jgi:hypothetical protein
MALSFVLLFFSEWILNIRSSAIRKILLDVVPEALKLSLTTVSN